MKARPRCTKRCFADEIAAKLALAQIQRRDNPARPCMEVRAYLHPQCHAWHLTSMKRGSYAN